MDPCYARRLVPIQPPDRVPDTEDDVTDNRLAFLSELIRNQDEVSRPSLFRIYHTAGEPSDQGPYREPDNEIYEIHLLPSFRAISNQVGPGRIAPDG